MIAALGILTGVHVVISLIAIIAGLAVVLGMVRGKPLDTWNPLFLLMSAATSVTGFMFPAHQLTPAHILGILLLVTLGIASFALYRRRLAGGWARTYAISVVIALYFNVFVLVVQSFEKVPSLRALAPTQTETPFKAVQLVVLISFILMGILTSKYFRGQKAAQSASPGRS